MTKPKRDWTWEEWRDYNPVPDAPYRIVYNPYFDKKLDDKLKEYGLYFQERKTSKRTGESSTTQEDRKG